MDAAREDLAVVEVREEVAEDRTGETDYVSSYDMW